MLCPYLMYLRYTHGHERFPTLGPILLTQPSPPLGVYRLGGEEEGEGAHRRGFSEQ